MDVSEFYDTFFEEAGELLADMETQLLELDPQAPDAEQLNAIFRAAHSIKGGAGTFGFEALQHSTHLMENLLDCVRQGEMALRRDIIDTFLETKDMLDTILGAYRDGCDPDPDVLDRVCKVLQNLAAEEMGEKAAGAVVPEALKSAPKAASEAGEPTPAGSEAIVHHYTITLLDLKSADRKLLIEEMAHFGEVQERGGDEKRYEVSLAATDAAEDIEAVLCFIVEPEQVEMHESTDASANAAPTAAAPVEPVPAEPVQASPRPKPAAAASKDRKSRTHAQGENSSIRVPVNKVDHIINLVGELIITQSMLSQVTAGVEDNKHGHLTTGMDQLKRNARDLQEAVMSVRMVPMDYVFSRFPRLVRDLARKLDKEVDLVTEGRSTELDKSLTERIIDPLTHLVRNSLDHGLEHPDEREAAGKPRAGQLTLAAEHQGGNIVIEVRDDGAGLARDKILAKARERGLEVSDAMSDREVWQLIFAPGFSTSATVSDVSGRGVGMDVVRSNIEAMDGDVEVLSEQGRGTTTRIVLPLTLAILDGISVRVGGEMFIIPVTAVIESLQPRADDLFGIGGGEPLLKVRDDYLPLCAVHRAMGVVDAQTDPTRAIAVIVQGRSRRYALLVDDLVGQQQVVVKNLETNYRKVPGVSAATILGDGSVALILDVNSIQRIDGGDVPATASRGAAIDMQP